MKGLLCKDLLVLKKGVGYSVPVIVLMVILLNNNFTMVYSILFCTLFPWSVLAYDEQARWDRMALMLPVSRREIVLSKYLIGWLGMGAATLLGAVNALLRRQSGAAVLLLASLACGLLVMSLLLPIMFRYGAERGRVIVMLITFLVVALSTMLHVVIEGFAAAGHIGFPAALLATLLAATFSWLTVPISVRAYEKRVM
ncbi:MAG: ABC-2 transporter permease [Clostridia bacterium]|nr:ABC-2 transporter permease [Clostridia bacterium]